MVIFPFKHRIPDLPYNSKSHNHYFLIFVIMYLILLKKFGGFKLSSFDGGHFHFPLNNPEYPPNSVCLQIRLTSKHLK